MKKIIFTFLIAITLNSINAKDSTNHFFFGIKNTFGKSYYNHFINGKNLRSGKYNNGFTNITTITFGGVISNFNISSGIGYALFNQKVDLRYLRIENQDDVVYSGYYKYKYQFISIPLELNYRINLAKNKLFLNIGTGVSSYLILSSEIILPENSGTTILSNNPMYTKEISKYSHILSLSLDTRLGFLYNINKRLDIYTNFEYSNMLVGMQRPINSETNYSLKPYLLGASLGFNIKF